MARSAHQVRQPKALFAYARTSPASAGFSFGPTAWIDHSASDYLTLPNRFSQSDDVTLGFLNDHICWHKLCITTGRLNTARILLAPSEAIQREVYP